MNRVSALATTTYDFAGQLYGMLPVVYRRFDPPDGPLRRFLDMPGRELDALYSLTRSLLGIRDVEHTEGDLLPLLAQWIGWPTDERLPVSAQRLQIRLAPRLYAVVGAPPVVRSTVARITGRSSQVKEYVHNVARTNDPERLLLWTAVRDTAGAWTPDTLLSPHATSAGRIRHVRDRDGAELFVFHVERPHGPDIWAKRYADGQWAPSEPLVDRPGRDLNPAVARHGDVLWLFWEQLGADGRWDLAARTRAADGTWSDAAVPAGDGSRRSPATVADDAGGLWLFWREWLGHRWQIRYARHDGTAWQPDPPAVMPDDNGSPVAAEDDLVAVPAPDGGGIWLFWARPEPGGPPGQTRWSIAWRAAQGADPATVTWSPVRLVPKDNPADHEREPYPLRTPAGDLELFRASTRGAAGWTVARSVLDVAALTWGPAETVTPAAAGSRRAPAAVPLDDGSTLLMLRSAAAVAWGAGTLDTRYGGTRTVRASDEAARDRRRQFTDDQSYTCRVGRTSRETVGVFLPGPPPGPDEAERLAGVLHEFMPVTAQAVLLKPNGEEIPR
ncbi:hypothetical protein [Paractinoplanes durhamensis]|uniref:hypothetical protein n=1 Tax=Paractinoplanes durhamensis TaxID=113563 RepID=UPI003640012A